jgi:hypothetical protein
MSRSAKRLKRLKADTHWPGVPSRKNPSSENYDFQKYIARPGRNCRRSQWKDWPLLRCRKAAIGGRRSWPTTVLGNPAPKGTRMTAYAIAACNCGKAADNRRWFPYDGGVEEMIRPQLTFCRLAN